MENRKFDQWFMDEMGGQFWTSLEEMVEDIQEYGYTVLLAYDEYIVVENDTADEEDSVIIYLGHANNTIWIESARNM